MPGNQTLFNMDWMDPDICPEWSKWVAPVKNFPNSVRCTKCSKKFSLSNMGTQALKSHEEGKVHQKRLRSQNFQTSVASLFNQNMNEVSTDKNLL